MTQISNYVHAKMETYDAGNHTDKLDSPLENAAIQEYETEASLLKSQVEFYKNEHSVLRNELTSLIDENHNLSEQLHMALASKVAYDQASPYGHTKDLDMVANIKQQFVLTVQEKDAAIEMWQSALKEIGSLEEELKNYQGSMSNNLAQIQLDKVKEQYSEAITLLEAKLTWVKNELSKERSLRDSLSGETEKLKLTCETHCKLIEAQKDQLQETLKRQTDAEERVASLEGRLHSALEENNALSNSRQELEAALSCCHESIATLKGKYEEACSKVEEALLLLEHASAERDGAVLAEATMRDENIKSQEAISRLINDAGTKVKEEVDLIKTRYNQQIEKVLFDMKKLEDKLADKSAQLEKVMRDYSATQDELDRVSRFEAASSQPGTMVLEQKMQQLFQELSDLHHRNFQLTKENDSLFLQLNNLKNRYEQDLERSRDECKLLEQQLVETRSLYIEAAGQVQQLSEQLQLLQQDMELFQQRSSRELNSVIDCLEQQELEKYIQERDELISRLQEVQVKSVETANELHRHLESQQAVKNKWKKTVKTITQEFETRLKELRNETNAFRDENLRLKEELNNLNAEIAVFQHIGNT